MQVPIDEEFFPPPLIDDRYSGFPSLPKGGRCRLLVPFPFFSSAIDGFPGDLLPIRSKRF